MQNSHEDVIVSIVIPMFNGETTIERTINSCLKQTFKLIEIIVVDDASIDESVQIVKAIALQNYRVRLIENKVNQGLCKNANCGIAIAHGKYVLILGQDDMICEHHIEKIVKCFDDSISMVHCNCALIDSNDNIYNINKWNNRELFFRDFTRNNAVLSCGALLRKDYVIKVGGYPEFTEYPNYGEWYLWIKLLQTGRIVPCDSVIALYRRHDGNISNSFINPKKRVLLNRYWNKCRLLAISLSKLSWFEKLISYCFVIKETFNLYFQYLISSMIK